MRRVRNEKMYITNGRVRLAVEIRGNGRPVIFGHGLTGSKEHTLCQLEPFFGKYKVIAFDQRGHGESTPITEPELYSAEDMAGDIGAILDKLKIDDAIIGGESMGCATATVFAMKNPDRVNALLLSMPALSDRVIAQRQTVLDMGRDISMQGMKKFCEGIKPQWIAQGFSAAAADHWASILIRHQAASLATACEIVSGWTIARDLREIAELSMPVKIIAMRSDPLHEFSLAERMAGIFPDADLEELPPLCKYNVDVAAAGRIFLKWLKQRKL